MTLWPEVRRLLTLLQDSGLGVRPRAVDGELVVELAVSPKLKYQACFDLVSGALLAEKNCFVVVLERVVWLREPSGHLGSWRLLGEPLPNQSKTQQIVALLSHLRQ